MRYLIAGLLIGGFLGQMFGYAVAGQHPRIVEVEVAGKLEESPPVQKMRGLMAAMPLAVNIIDLGTMPEPVAPRPRARATREKPVDEVGLLIAMGGE